MPCRSLWRCPHAQLRVLANNVKQNRRLFTASAYELARVTSNDLTKKEEEFDEVKLAELNQNIDEAEVLLRYDPEYQPFEENEAGMLQKKLCDIYSSYKQLEDEADGETYLMRVMVMLDDASARRTSRYRRMMRAAEILVSGLEQEILRSVPGLPMSREPRTYTFGFYEAADRLGIPVAELLSVNRSFKELFDRVYWRFTSVQTLGDLVYGDEIEEALQEFDVTWLTEAVSP